MSASIPSHTNAYIGSGVTAPVGGDIEVIAGSAENLISVSAGVAVSGTAAVGVNAGVHVFNLQTRAFIGDDPKAPAHSGAGDIVAAGDVEIAANDASNISEIVGVLAAGQVGVAAGVGVNVFTKDTESFIGQGAGVIEGQIGLFSQQRPQLVLMAGDNAGLASRAMMLRAVSPRRRRCWSSFLTMPNETPETAGHLLAGTLIGVE